MIKRDKYGIIVQHNLDHPEQADGGDSASRTGIMAMCGKLQDAQNLYRFIHLDTRLIRHPMQPIWRQVEETSRDQLICFAAGVNRFPTVSVRAIDALKIHASENFINKDVLLPFVRYALYKAAQINPPLWIRLIAKPTMLAHLIWSTKIRPNEEQNQTLCLCSIYGDEWVKRHYNWHPDLNLNLYSYWAGKPWRDQREIYEAMMNFIKGKL